MGNNTNGDVPLGEHLRWLVGWATIATCSRIANGAGLVFVPGFDFDVVEGEGCECSDEC